MKLHFPCTWNDALCGAVLVLMTPSRTAELFCVTSETAVNGVMRSRQNDNVGDKRGRSGFKVDLLKA